MFVYVRDGHIQITSNKDILDLGRGETGIAGFDGRLGRPEDAALFIQHDTVPMPNSLNPMLVNLLNDAAGGGSNNMCR